MNRRIRLAAIAAMAMLTSMICAAGTIAAQACRGTRQRPSRPNVATVATATLCIVNQIRHAHHLRPLRMNSVLRSIAAGQSHDMLVGGYFGDDSLSGLTPLQRVATSSYGRGSKRISVSQDIAWGLAVESTPLAIVQAWMQSAPHREILLTPLYREVGVGIGLGVPQQGTRAPGATYTLDLASRVA
jgi:uncharacterized protein YkwD